MLDATMRTRLCDGMVIPAHPLAITADRDLDEARQRALTDYYLSSGADGLAVGVHTTQFEIHDPALGWYRSVLELAAERAAAHVTSGGQRPLLVAGVLGPTARAVAETETAAALGYDMALVATPGWGDAPEREILDGVAAVGRVLPVFGFYLQRAIAGRTFGYQFWRNYVDIDSVAAIKIAPFNRYATLEVIRAVIDGGRTIEQAPANAIALYTGNDDSIVTDLLTPFHIGGVTTHIVGGLLGQWATWTPAVVALHRRIREVVTTGGPVPLELLALGARLTDANGAVFDAANRFAGSIAGVNEVLTRSGILAGNWCLGERERLSPGQQSEIDRVIAAYPELSAM